MPSTRQIVTSSPYIALTLVSVCVLPASLAQDSFRHWRYAVLPCFVVVFLIKAFGPEVSDSSQIAGHLATEKCAGYLRGEDLWVLVSMSPRAIGAAVSRRGQKLFPLCTLSASSVSLMCQYSKRRWIQDPQLARTGCAVVVPLSAGRATAWCRAVGWKCVELNRRRGLLASRGVCTLATGYAFCNVPRIELGAT